MSNPYFPNSPEVLNEWCHQRGLKLHEGQSRFAEFVILESIASHSILHSAVALKGGNALRFFYRSPRSTLDLDFTVVSDIPDNADELRILIDRALMFSVRRFNVKTKCQRVKRNPKSDAKTLPTYDITVAYQFPSDPYFNNFDDRTIPTVIHVELSFNDLVCEMKSIAVEDTSEEKLQVCTLEDIVAEKLRSLLQQPHRKRNRSQDVFDIARAMREFGSQLDRRKISEFLLRKSDARGIEVRRSFFDDTIRTMARENYDTRVREQSGKHFINFDDAYADVISLIDTLVLPP